MKSYHKNPHGTNNSKLQKILHRCGLDHGDLYDLAAAVSQERGRCETELVAAILSDPACGLKLARENRVIPELIEQEDLRLIFLAIVVVQIHGRLTGCRDDDQFSILSLARHGLRDQGYWNAQGGISFGSHWSDETLVLLTQQYPGTAAVPSLCRHLIDLHKRLRDAAEHLHYAQRRLLGE